MTGLRPVSVLKRHVLQVLCELGHSSAVSVIIARLKNLLSQVLDFVA